MTMDENPNYYEILNITPEASTQTVRDAYVRSKSTFSSDNVALYSLISAEERDEALQKIEEAYQILANPDSRKTYNKTCGFRHFEESIAAAKVPSKVVSIDRTPPMEMLSDEQDPLIPPRTDYMEHIAPPAYSSNIRATSNSSYSPPITPDLAEAIELETEWRGSFLRKVRDAYQISLEEMSGMTKITKTYLIAIEEDNHKKLPAFVYVRGFITQIAKTLKLPPDKVAKAYLSRIKMD